MTQKVDLTSLTLLPAAPKAGRPKRAKVPPLPDEITQAMSEIEREHFDSFIALVREAYPDLLPTDLMYLNMAAINYVQVLRVKEWELRGKQMLGISKTNPENQMLRWLDMLSVTRKQRNPGKSATDEEKSAWGAFFNRTEN